jgi:hypothetical protein
MYKTDYSFRTDAAGEVVLHFSRDAESNFSVVSGYIKHTARYQSKASSSSLLEVRLIRPLRVGILAESKMLVRIQARSQFAAASRVSCPPGQLGEWIEASILSARAEECFEENKSLSFAERTGWTCTKLEEDGVFHDICRPALSMVTLMDHIGTWNDNKQGPRGHSSAIEQQPLQAESSKFEFW